MNKSELVDAIAEKRGLPRKRAEAVVEMVFEMMVDSLKQGERIEVRGFGSFVVKHYGAYQGRNPRSGQPIQVKEKRLPFFKVGKELKERVDADKTPIAVDHDDADEDSTPPAPAPAPAAPDPAGGGGPGST
ncbi:MAG: integration host factor subunit beta [Deltaproteobacteria bacterium]|nr:integration host factor subunit beta [Deltaproteobacteria bacterium]